MRRLFKGDTYSSLITVTGNSRVYYIQGVVITFKTLLHLGQNVITFRTLLHLGQNVITFRAVYYIWAFYLYAKRASCSAVNPLRFIALKTLYIFPLF